jgi:hypothetical protein
MTRRLIGLLVALTLGLLGAPLGAQAPPAGSDLPGGGPHP